MHANSAVKFLVNEVCNADSSLKFRCLARCEKVIKPTAVAQMQHALIKYCHIHQRRSELSRPCDASLQNSCASGHDPDANSSCPERFSPLLARAASPSACAVSRRSDMGRVGVDDASIIKSAYGGHLARTGRVKAKTWLVCTLGTGRHRPDCSVGAAVDRLGLLLPARCEAQSMLMRVRTALSPHGGRPTPQERQACPKVAHAGSRIEERA